MRPVMLFLAGGTQHVEHLVQVALTTVDQRLKASAMTKHAPLVKARAQHMHNLRHIYNFTFTQALGTLARNDPH